MEQMEPTYGDPKMELKELAKKNFEEWNALLKTGDAEKVAGIYTDDATFLPTMSGEFKRGKSGAAEYFKHFLEKHPTGEIVEDEIQPISEGSTFYSGRYDFEVGSEESRSNVEARFSFLWNPEGKISHHHSSQMNKPEGYSPESKDDSELSSKAKKLFADWNQSLQARNSKEVAGHYSDDATFLPTVSGDFKKGQAGAKEYFEHFLQKDPNGKIVEGVAQDFKGESYLHSGMYNFEVDDENNPGQRKTVQARFTYVWTQDENGSWKIAHHHSSIRPESH